MAISTKRAYVESLHAESYKADKKLTIWKYQVSIL